MFFIVNDTPVHGGKINSSILNTTRLYHFPRPHIWIFQGHKEMIEHAQKQFADLHRALEDKSKKTPIPEAALAWYGVAVLRRTPSKRYMFLPVLAMTQQIIEFKAHDIILPVCGGLSEVETRAACQAMLPTLMRSAIGGWQTMSLKGAPTPDNFVPALRQYCPAV